MEQRESRNPLLPAVLLADERGIVRVVNEAAARLLRCQQDGALGRPCWKVARLRTVDGHLICGAADCPALRPGAQGDVRLVVLPGRAGPYRLVSYVIPPARPSRQPVLHLLMPDGAAGAPSWSEDELTAATARLADLSRREREVLRLLADGRDTAGIAHRLFISRVTVRNHVQRILRKLGVHSRLDAVIALLRADRRDADASTSPPHPRE